VKKNRGGVFIYNLNKTFPLIFTGRKLRPPGIGIEASHPGPRDVWGPAVA